MCVCVCVCVCEMTRKREKNKVLNTITGLRQHVCVRVCVCVCDWLAAASLGCNRGCTAFLLVFLLFTGCVKNNTNILTYLGMYVVITSV